MDNPLSTGDIHNILTTSSQDYEDCIVHIDSIEKSNYNIDALFRNRYAIILFLENPLQEVGHFTLLSHLKSDKLEYFDSFGKEPPESVVKLAQINNMKLTWNKEQLQDDRSNTCARHCILRMTSLPTNLTNYLKLFDNKSMSPDEIVLLLIKGRNELS